MNIKRIVVISLIIVLSGIVIYYYYKDYSLGSRHEREELLTAVVFDLSENKGIKQEDIEEIYIIRSYAGVYPFFYQARVNLKGDRDIWYDWIDKDKTGVKTISHEDAK